MKVLDTYRRTRIANDNPTPLAKWRRAQWSKPFARIVYLASFAAGLALPFILAAVLR